MKIKEKRKIDYGDLNEAQYDRFKVQYAVEIITGCCGAGINLIEWIEFRGYKHEGRYKFTKIETNEMKTKLKTIKKARKKVVELQNAENCLFDKLTDELDIEKSNDLADWLWDYVFNGTDHSLRHLEEQFMRESRENHPILTEEEAKTQAKEFDKVQPEEKL